MFLYGKGIYFANPNHRAGKVAEYLLERQVMLNLETVDRVVQLKVAQEIIDR